MAGESLDGKSIGAAKIPVDPPEAIVTSIAAIQEGLEAANKRIADHDKKLKILDGMVSAGYAVNLRFLIQYAYQVVKVAAKKSHELAEGNRDEYESFLTTMPEHIVVHHPDLHIDVRCKLKDFATTLSKHSALAGLLSHVDCHSVKSSTVKIMAASVEAELGKAVKGTKTVLSKKELEDLQGLFAALFQKSTGDVLASDDPAFSIPMKLPIGNHDY